MLALLLSDEAWLNATNALLGIVSLICILVAGAAVFHDVANRIRSRAKARTHYVFDDHSFHVPELGMTMADGGERVDPPAEPKK